MTPKSKILGSDTEWIKRDKKVSEWILILNIFVFFFFFLQGEEILWRFYSNKYFANRVRAIEGSGCLDITLEEKTKKNFLNHLDKMDLVLSSDLDITDFESISW